MTEDKHKELRQRAEEILLSENNRSAEDSIYSLQTAIYVLKTRQVELELQNNELRRAQEELETSKEELQSLNEEAASVMSSLRCWKIAPQFWLPARHD